MPPNFAAIAAVQEEIGLFGARASAFAVDPDLAVVVDVTHATDAPGIDEKEVGSHPLGSGPAIGRGSTLSPKVFEHQCTPTLPTPRRSPKPANRRCCRQAKVWIAAAAGGRILLYGTAVRGGFYLIACS